MAFSPDYAVSGRFYVFLTTGIAGDFDVEVWEYRVSADPDVADAATARRVIVVPHDDATNHVGGQLAFGPDGYLYVGIGDGGLQGDPMNRAQDPALLLGKILRIDPRGTAPDAHVIPPGNAPGAAPQVWALGLRNPWRFSFDRVTGALLIGDVGDDVVRGDRPAPARHGGRHQLRLAQLRGPAPARRPARARERRGADPRVRAQRRLRPLLDHGRLRRARSERARARRPLRLRRLLRRVGAQPDPDRAGGERRSRGGRRRPGARSRLLRRGRPLPRLRALGGRPGLPPRQHRARPRDGLPRVAGAARDAAARAGPRPDARRRGARDGAAAARRGAAVGPRGALRGPTSPRPASSRPPSTPPRGGRSACARSAIAARPPSTSRGARRACRPTARSRCGCGSPTWRGGPSRRAGSPSARPCACGPWSRRAACGTADATTIVLQRRG